MSEGAGPVVVDERDVVRVDRAMRLVAPGPREAVLVLVWLAKMATKAGLSREDFQDEVMSAFDQVASKDAAK